MNEMSHEFEAAQSSAFRFTGNWREFAPIAFSNLALTLATLGIYRFWAKSRERRYLWSRTEFIDDTLEWTGTGFEMFRGFVIAIFTVTPLLLFFQFGSEALMLRGHVAAALLGLAITYFALLMLTGMGQFLALRYRLSRTYWHGIRGGGETGALAYGWSWLWKSLAGSLALSMLVPWSMVELWNQRWNKMSFGPHRFEAYATTEGLFGRWILVLLSPAAALLLVMLLWFSAAGFGLVEPVNSAAASENPWQAGLFLVVFMGVVYTVVATAGVGYYAAYFRTVITSLDLGGLRFEFTATSRQWLMLFLGHAAIVVGTLGLGLVFLSYRNWAFFIRHLEAAGVVDLDELTQSPAAQTGDAEGLAAAFDLGAM